MENGYSYEEIMKKSYSLLDSLDIKKYLIAGSDLHDIMDEIEDEYREALKDDEFFEEDPFNWMDIYDFGQYLSKRYAPIFMKILV